jgi:hypothetical protein
METEHLLWVELNERQFTACRPLEINAGVLRNLNDKTLDSLLRDDSCNVAGCEVAWLYMTRRMMLLYTRASTLAWTTERWQIERWPDDLRATIESGGPGES